MMSSTRHPVDSRCAVVLAAPATTPPSTRRADRSGHTKRKTEISAPAWPFGSASASEERRSATDATPFALPACRRFGAAVDRCFLRSGMSFIQADSPPLVRSTHSAGPLRSTGITPLPRYYEPPPTPERTAATVMHSRAAVDVSPRALVARRVSQVPRWSVDTRRPLSPRRARPLHMLVASRSMAGFTPSGRLATLNLL